MLKCVKRAAALSLAALMLMTVAVGCGKNESQEDTTTTTVTTEATTVPTTTTTMVNGSMDEELSVREGPGFSYSVIGGVAAGQGIEIVGRSGDWFKIRFGDGFGYVNAHYVAVEGQPNASQMQADRPLPTTTTAAANVGVIKKDKVSVYPAPDASSDVIGEIGKDTEVTIISREEEFYQIQFGTGIGFIPADTVDAGKTTTPSTGTGEVTTTTVKGAIPDTQVEDPLA